jgi:flavodoxin I
MSQMNKTAIFYGPVGGSTEYVAKKIHEIIGKDNCDLNPVLTSVMEDLEKYDNLILGIATIGMETWQAEKPKSGWFTFVSDLGKADLKGRKVAMFGLGDHIRYADHFVDSLGEIYEVALKRGAEIVGSVSTEGYEFGESKAVVDGRFVGLPIDEDFQSDLTLKRIKTWVKEILPEFGM